MTRKLTRERLEELAAGQSGFNLRIATHEESQELARMALAAMDSEPDCNERKLFCSTDTARMRKVISVSAGSEATPLHRHAQQPVVPPELTKDMEMEYFLRDDWKGTFRSGWDACRAAALKAGNSPVIPESCSAQFGNFQHYWHSKGYVLVPNEPTEAMCDISHIGVDVYCGKTDDNEYYSIGGAEAAKVWKAMLAAATHDTPDLNSVQSVATVSDTWIPVSEQLPEECGRYWCYVEEQTDLGKSHYQWNCSWNGERWLVEGEDGGIVTHWMPLPAAPQEVKK